MAALGFVAVCGMKAVRAAASTSPPPVQWALLGIATFALVVDNFGRTLHGMIRRLIAKQCTCKQCAHSMANISCLVPSLAAAALNMAHNIAVLARRALDAAAVEAAEAAHAAAAQLASERLVWEAELERQRLKLTIEQELSHLMDDRERRGLQRFVVRAGSLCWSRWLALFVCGRHCRRSYQR